MNGFNDLLGLMSALSRNLNKVDKRKFLIFLGFIFLFGSLVIFPQSVNYGGGISGITSNWIDISIFGR